MNCPNCSFEIDPASPSCPYCNFAIPSPGAPGAKEPVSLGGPSAGPEPAPGDAAGDFDPDAIPDLGDIEPVGDSNDPLGAQLGALDEHMAQRSAARSAQAAAQAAAASGAQLQAQAGEQKFKEALKYAGIAGAALLAFKVGLFDNLLTAVGLKAQPPSQGAVAKAPSDEEPSERPEPEPAGGSDPGGAPAEPAPAQPPPAGAAPAGTQPAGNRDLEKILLQQAGVAPGEQPAAQPGEPAAEPAAAAAPEEWWFYGQVYDLMTLRPVRGAELTFVGGEQTLSFRTDAKGQYQAKAPATEDAPGYEVLVDHADYVDVYLIDKQPSYKSLGAGARGQLRASLPKHPPWAGARGKWVRRDLVLIPAVYDKKR